MKTFTLLKSLAFLSLYLLPVATSSAQTATDNPLTKGKQLVGFSLNTSWGGHFGFIGNVGVRYGYLPLDRVIVGTELNYGFNGSAFKDIRPGVFARYHFNSQKISPFVEGAYYRSFGWEQTENNGKWNSLTTNDARLGLGVKFRDLIKDKLSFEVMGGYSTQRKAFYEFRFALHF